MLVTHEPVGVRDDSIHRVKLGQQIQRAGSAVPAVRLVEHLQERVSDGPKKLLAERTVERQASLRCGRTGWTLLWGQSRQPGRQALRR